MNAAGGCASRLPDDDDDVATTVEQQLANVQIMLEAIRGSDVLMCGIRSSTPLLVSLLLPIITRCVFASLVRVVINQSTLVWEC